MVPDAGKLFSDYSQLSSKQAFLEEPSIDMGIPVSTRIVGVKGGLKHLQGT